MEAKVYNYCKYKTTVISTSGRNLYMTGANYVGV